MVNFAVFDDRPFDVRGLIADPSSLEGRDVETYFRKRRLSEITLKSLRDNYKHDASACLLFMTPRAFAYFLPAFMRIALQDYEEADFIPEAVIGRLLEMAEGRDNERAQAIISSYSGLQIKAIADFLREMSFRYWHEYAEDTAKRSLDRYWGPLAASYE